MHEVLKIVVVIRSHMDSWSSSPKTKSMLLLVYLERCLITIHNVLLSFN